MSLSDPHRRHTLPANLSSFVGRQNEMGEVKRLLATTRLLTLTGPGGAGKTRLALAVSRELLSDVADGVFLAEFAPLADPALVPQVVAAALHLREQAAHSLMERLAQHLEQREALLVFDNCEHLATACAQLAEALLGACPDLTILATSRELLNVPGETVWVVPPLSLPEPQPWRGPGSAGRALEAYQHSEAVRLFAERAAAASPAFALSVDNGPWVAEICRRLDGMPLAIELAAARARVLSPQQIAERLDDRFHLLTSGSRTAPARHQSLAATLDWSYALLDEPEQKLLRRLAVFAGGFSLAAAEAVCAGPDLDAAEVLTLLSSVVDKSLVQADQAASETRYRLLETVRQYAARRLAEAGEEPAWRDRHLAYFVAWAAEAQPYFNGPNAVAWLDRFEREHDNLRAALTWSHGSAARAGQGLQLAGCCGPFWRMRGVHTEGRQRLQAALDQPGAHWPENQRHRPVPLYWASLLAFFQSDYAAARALAQANLDLCQALGDDEQESLANALEILAEVDIEQGQYAAGERRYEQALEVCRAMGDTAGVGNALTMLGWVVLRSGDYERAAARLDEALDFCRVVSHPTILAQALSARGELAVRQGPYDVAETLLNESLALRQRIGEAWGIAVSLGTLGWLALRQGQLGRAQALLGESLTIRLESGDVGGSAWCLERLAEAALLAGGPGAERAARLYGAAAAQRARVNAVMDSVDQSDYEGRLADLRAGLGPASFSAAWAAGSALSLEQAADDALTQPPMARPGAAPAREAFGGLTARERQVAALVAQGHSNRKIADAMVVNVKTVETYVSRILSKLAFESRVQIATWAVEQGLDRPNPR